MENSIVFIGIALLSVVNICNAANVVDRQNNSFQAEIFKKTTFQIGHKLSNLIWPIGIQRVLK